MIDDCQLPAGRTRAFCRAGRDQLPRGRGERSYGDSPTNPLPRGHPLRRSPLLPTDSRCSEPGYVTVASLNLPVRGSLGHRPVICQPPLPSISGWDAALLAQQSLLSGLSVRSWEPSFPLTTSMLPHAPALLALILPTRSPARVHPEVGPVRPFHRSSLGLGSSRKSWSLLASQTGQVL